MWEGIVREFGVEMYTLLYLKWITTRTYCTEHRTLNVMWQPGWEGSLGAIISNACRKGEKVPTIKRQAVT